MTQRLGDIAQPLPKPRGNPVIQLSLKLIG